MSPIARRLFRGGASLLPPVSGLVGNGLSANPAFFPIAVWLQTPESNAANYKNIGVNMFIGLYSGITNSNLSALNASSLIAGADQNSIGLTDPLSPAVMKAWTQQDEPDNAQPNGTGGYGPAIPVSTITANYNAIKAADSLHRPVYLNFSQAVGNPNWIGIGYNSAQRETIYTQYSAGADIVSFDVYPVNNSLPIRDVADGVDNLRRWTNYQKPVYFWVECTRYDTTNGTPTPAQVKCEVWLGLTHGANGFGYFCHVFTPTFSEAGLLTDGTMSAAVHAINTQVTSLAAVLNSATIANGVTVSGVMGIHTMVKQYGGSTYVFAVSENTTITTPSFQMTGVTNATAVVDGESRSIAVTSGGFGDTFTAYAVHIYKIS